MRRFCPNSSNNVIFFFIFSFFGNRTTPRTIRSELVERTVEGCMGAQIAEEIKETHEKGAFPVVEGPVIALPIANHSHAQTEVPIPFSITERH